MRDWSQIATLQLLENWRRCGIGKIPRSSAEGVERASRWLEQVWLESGVKSADLMGLVASDSEPESSAGVATTSTTSRMQLEKLDGGEITAAVPPQTSNATGSIGLATHNKPTAPASIVVGTTEASKWTESPLDLVGRENRFKILSQDAAACRKCTEIACSRKQTVFGVGPLTARLVMFGEAPGADEDRVGQPFVGAAGQLMDKILIASGLRREDVYIMNSLKCRPPNNRTPTDIEIENCRPFFDSQLETIQPEYIICWGAVAVRAVLKTTESVGRLRGRFHQYRGAKVLVTYHPAYLLRNPDAKRLTWEDMKFLMKELGIPLPPPKKA